METDYILQHFIKFHVCIDIFQRMLQYFRGAVHWWACAVPFGDFADCPHGCRSGLEGYFMEQRAPVVLQTASLLVHSFWCLCFLSGEGQRAPLPFAQCLLMKGRAPWSWCWRAGGNPRAQAVLHSLRGMLASHGLISGPTESHHGGDVTFLLWLSWLTFSSMKVVMWCVPAGLQSALHTDVYEDLWQGFLYARGPAEQC